LIGGGGRITLPTCLSVLAFAAASTAAGPTPTDIVVDARGESLTVRIAAPTPLRVVLETVCERTEANCKLPAKTTDTLIESRTVHGSWFEVMGELLHGSDLSFAVTPPVRGRNAYLVVELAAAASAHANTGLPSASSGAGASGVTAGAETPIVEAEPMEEAQPAVEPEPDATPRAETMSPDSPLVTAATAAATPGASFAMTPFSDSSGNPLMSRLGNQGGGAPGATPGMAVLPYSDQIGNPLVVPITNEPLSLTPFAGPDGQAWPAPVPQPNQKLEYPIPPTAPKKDER
jgi:hypothetical protein